MNIIILYQIVNCNIAQILIDNGADLNATDNDGNTALHNAATSGNFRHIYIVPKVKLKPARNKKIG